MRFVDRVRILVRAGNGGRGHVGWRREKFVPRGGPAGGDGGKGGDVIFVADESLTTLLDLRYQQHYQAEHGKPGRNKMQNGPGGEDRRIRVPVGTMVYLEGVAGEPGERPPWLEDGGDVEDAGDLETIYVFEDELDGDDEPAEGEEESGEDAAVADQAADDGTDGQSEAVEPDAAEGETDEGEAAEGDADEGAAGDGDAAEGDADEGDADEGETDEGEADEGDADEGEADEFIVDDDTLDQDDGPAHSAKVARQTQDLPLVGDLVSDGQELVIAHGGRGGRGNVHFRSSRNRAPHRAEPGWPGEAFWLRLELKLLADVGIVGFPNVGKSTLIRTVSRARPKVGDYPFTTLVPQLGVVSLPGERSMVIADVPGLIRGASEGRGLGLDFLRHLERTRVLLHLLAPDPEEGREPLADLEALEAELAAYGPIFAGKPRVVALNKVDTPEAQAMIPGLRRRLRARRIPLFPISAVTGDGVPELLEALYRRVALSREREKAREGEGGSAAEAS